jgi:predicted nucleic acid-binding protein
VSFYLDASVIVPTFVDEAASKDVERFILRSRETLVVGDFAALEVASAISRLVRMKSLAPDVAATLLHDFDLWRSARTSSLDLLPSHFRLAERLTRRFDLGLRGPDALHLAVCLQADYTLVTLDRRLAAAAEILGARVDRVT